MNKIKIGTVAVADKILTVYIIKATADEGLRVILYDAEGNIHRNASLSSSGASSVKDNEFIVHGAIGRLEREDLLISGLFEDTGKFDDIAPALPVWRLKK